MNEGRLVEIWPHVQAREHRKKYGALVELLGFDNLRRLLPIQDPEKLRRKYEADERLNNIPLPAWDARHPHVVALVRSVAVREGRRIPWSMCCTVCTLKETARQIVEGRR